ncbi:hypothetical protein Q4534_23730 [Cyclobacterium sp. 1_MG-2023]|uniref:hypothetical protein n=1 Tax=Cyclobacterium sp. 1_MG-2023 TaxID=3062681 RepID=UPI0026E4904E|nr:hypothetical protein [Cyclobacterium sp. 1_MG-2023]MDO6440456.1 hypothetical protein [Cyclobacterium sp. 1_MG-2023]
MKTVLYILITLISTVSYGQISGTDSDKADLLIDNYRNYIDSTDRLTNGAKIFYISDTLFKGMILTLKNGDKIELDLRYKYNYRGYTELGVDFENYVLIKNRGDGSGNPEQLRVINKNTGEDRWIGNYPFYLDKEKEIGVYKAYTDSSSQIVVHDFSTNKTEAYPTPDTKCICCGCYEIVQFDNDDFTIKFVDPDDNETELKMKRKK